ncbi:amylo-alpha-1,6-glucosidase [Dethiobacter alkaliphilus]|uniref:Glycogen debranching enzyme n=1 Tax=Dethiobacter alkaliphilus AHT 1 TaxID=555088 RepID=C0GDS8_DETAL|nr:amylo-alpha-1,6-glucosidase [Dethiobacter alkaliphilus]EEG78561.1 glycogen debranching enzyme [Dethiobacter alkaliphilus AHT 1]
MRFGPNLAGDWEKGAEKEWLLTNGLGDYAGGTIAGTNTRRYHGLLIASPPTGGGRRLFVSKVQEELTVEGKTYYLAANELADGYRQNGNIHLVEFILEPIPTFVYRLEDIYLIKELFMVHGEATTIVRYKLEANRPCSLRIYPLVNDRSHHSVNDSPSWPFDKKIEKTCVHVNSPDGPTVTLEATTGVFKEMYAWFHNMCYPHEKERGEEHLEHHFIPGFWEMEFESGGEFALSASLHGSRVEQYNQLYEKEINRRKEVTARVRTQKPLCRELARAGDKFIVKKNGETGIIAGYPWFDEWGRDTFISLPGLLLVTGMYEEARQVLAKYARYEQNGLMPNFIPDDGGEPQYNTVDASLWYIQAVKSYLDYTGDMSFIKTEIYPILKKIIQSYRVGTDYGIVMDADGLITAGEKGVQLTWMDAKVGEWVVTPRHGKAVEINALWYNALYFMTLLAGCIGDQDARKLYGELALRVQEKFPTTFWCVRHDYLADVVFRGERDERLRPNQIFALSLPYRLLSTRQEKQVLNAVGRHLYTPFGLRTLAPYETDYRPGYFGDRLSRDGAYHQGTAWAWLIGPYVSAYRRVHKYSRPSRKVATRMLAPFFHHLFDFGLASIAEIYDGEHPHTPRGCPYQAWSVAELLRVYVQEVLEKRPKPQWVCETNIQS